MKHLSENRRNRESRHLFVLELDGISEEHGANIAGVGARDGDDGGLWQIVENPSEIGGALTE